MTNTIYNTQIHKTRYTYKYKKKLEVLVDALTYYISVLIL